MLKALLAICVVTLTIICSAQDQPQDQAAVARSQMAAAIAAAGCGPSEVQFDVKGDNQQHPMPQAEPGRALIYVFADTTVSATTRLGLDSKWIGATQNGSYFFFPADPGEHRLCVNVQSNKPAPPGTAGTMTVEAGRAYYFEIQASGDQSGSVIGMQIQQLDDAEGQYMVATHSLSIPKQQAKPHDYTNDPIYNH